jgi:hypothetical protein
MTNATMNTLYSIWGSSPSDVFAVGSGGTILHYDGSAWSAMSSGTTNELDGVWGSSSSDVFAVGNGGTILHYDGSEWSPMSSGTTNDLTGIWGSSPSDVFAVGYDCPLLHYRERIPPGTTTDPVTNVTVNSARLNGNLTSLGTASSAQVSFEWGLPTGYSNNTTSQTMTEASVFSFALSDLSPATTYHFQGQGGR